jgi:hypothetical protein
LGQHYTPHTERAPEVVVDQLEPLQPILRVKLEDIGLQIGRQLGALHNILQGLLPAEHEGPFQPFEVLCF